MKNAKLNVSAVIVVLLSLGGCTGLGGIGGLGGYGYGGNFMPTPFASLSRAEVQMLGMQGYNPSFPSGPMIGPNPCGAMNTAVSAAVGGAIGAVGGSVLSGKRGATIGAVGGTVVGAGAQTVTCAQYKEQMAAFQQQEVRNRAQQEAGRTNCHSRRKTVNGVVVEDVRDCDAEVTRGKYEAW